MSPPTPSSYLDLCPDLPWYTSKSCNSPLTLHLPRIFDILSDLTVTPFICYYYLIDRFICVSNLLVVYQKNIIQVCLKSVPAHDICNRSIGCFLLPVLSDPRHLNQTHKQIHTQNLLNFFRACNQTFAILLHSENITLLSNTLNHIICHKLVKVLYWCFDVLVSRRITNLSFEVAVTRLKICLLSHKQFFL